MKFSDFINVAVASDKGVARENNEDSFLLLLDDGCFVIADGMGGGESGEVASKIVVDTISAFLKDSVNESPGERKYSFQQSIFKANASVVAYAKSHKYKMMGSTVVGLLIDSWDASTGYVSHIGDSRLYCLREGELFQITNDHTVAREMLKSSSKDVISAHLSHVLTRSIGGTDIPMPEWDEISICPNDIFLVCSDGVNTMLSDEEIAEYLSLDLSVADIAQNLVDKANDKGGTDNITAMVIKISPELPEPQPVDELEKQESNLLLEIAEKRVDYGTK